MSVQINLYLMYGIELDFSENYKELDDEKKSCFDNLEDSPFNVDDVYNKPIIALIDGMDGKYIRVGKVLYKSENYKLLNGSLDLNDIKLPKKSKLQKIIKKEFGIDVKKNDLKLMLFEHSR